MQTEIPVVRTSRVIFGPETGNSCVKIRTSVRAWRVLLEWLAEEW
jgi:hypothetical protein